MSIKGYNTEHFLLEVSGEPFLSMKEMEAEDADDSFSDNERP